MKTLAFCTAFGRGETIWRGRYRRWIKAMQTSGLCFDLLLLVDDGSPRITGFDDVPRLADMDAAADGIALYHFANSLGRPGLGVYPGWYRSFCWAGLYAERHGFNRVVHIESDAYLISRRVVDWANNLKDGWEAPWCPRIKAPESAIQVVAGDELESLFRVCRISYSQYVGGLAELFLPFTNVRRDLVGNRYLGDPVPHDADWGAQIHGGHPEEYFWWLRSTDHAVRAEPPRSRRKAQMMANTDTIDGIHERGHRAFVGGQWGTVGPMQLDFLIGRGLRPSDCFIDIGCGCLRGGVPLINFLDRGKYHGLDKFIELVILGVGLELSMDTYREKTPRFAINGTFDFSQFDTQFTFGIAQSLFTHLTREDAVRCLSALAPHAAAGCKLFCTFFEPEAPSRNPEQSHSHMKFSYTRDEMRAIGDSTGWDAHYVGDWGHPRGQMMMEMVRR